METDRASAWAGVASVGLTDLAILAATVASPTFRWTGDALSDLGQPGDAAATPVTTLLFDGGLVVGAVVGLAFALTLSRGAGHPVERVAALPFVVALIGLAGVGVFPYSQALHAPAAVTFYLASMVAMAAYAVGNALAGARVRGAVTLALVGVHVAVWYWWATGGAFTRGGLAVPEFAGALLFGGWVVWTARWHLAGERAGAAAPTAPSSTARTKG
ncbi:DUF998 domain-containing protein [Haloarcula litorea]|uniref:DUF998 domain-containing protein n=1 Tax=Haloarcula litorea TaxID=3032579 RepID=UPI0023E7A020|nr:DUF998 domain-containing protein [Halomicroarcula sp. GDY20]